MGRADSGPTWGCGGCGLDGNWASRDRCRGCGKAGPFVLRAGAHAEGRRGRAERGGAAPTQPPPGTPPSKRAARRAAKAQGAGAAADAEERAARLAKQVEQLTKELTERRAAQAPASPGDGDADMAGGAAAAGAATPELDASIVRKETLLRSLEDMLPELRDLVQGGYDATVARAQRELEELRKARRDAKPLAVRLHEAQGFHKRAQHRSRKATEAKEATVQARDAAQRTLEGLERQLIEHTEAEAKAKAEEAAAAAAAAAIGVGVAQGLDANAALPEGLCRKADAEAAFAAFRLQVEAAWARREAEVHALLTPPAPPGEAAGAAASAGPPGSPPPDDDDESVGGDAGDIDDARWQSIPANKRRAVLHKERNRFAAKARRTLQGGAAPPTRERLL